MIDKAIVKNRLYFRDVIITLVILVPLGIALKLYPGPGRNWINNYSAGIIYEIFWIVFGLIFVKSWRSAGLLPVFVFIATCLIEFAQLWHPGFLTTVRSCFAGQALLGTTFSWSDFPHYIAGCVLGRLYIKHLEKRYG